MEINENLGLDLDSIILKHDKGVENAQKLYHLLVTYNMYSIILLKAMQNRNGVDSNVLKDYSRLVCYRDSISDLLSLFKDNEYLKGRNLTDYDETDVLFLIDNTTLLRVMHYNAYDYRIGDAIINYDLLGIDDCKLRTNIENVYAGDPYYCDHHFENKKAFGLYAGENLITPSYVFDSKIQSYDGKSIREVLFIQSIEEIYEKITAAKDENVKKLILSK